MFSSCGKHAPPRIREREEPLAPHLPPAIPPLPSPGVNAGSRVLLVEDEEPLARALRTGLEAEGFTVVVASDGVRGLALAQSGDFDIVILDLMLPGLNGVRVCARLRESDATLPILV